MAREISGYPLTEQMESFIDAVIDGIDIKAFAFAGAGKSSTLRAVEKYHKDKKGLYICRDKSLEMEARALFSGHNVDIYTSHAFALNALDKDVKMGFMFLKDSEGIFNTDESRLKSPSYQEFINNIKVEETFDKTFNLGKHYKKIISCVEQYFYSSSTELSEIHLSSVANDYVDQLFKKKKITTLQIKQYKSIVIELAKKAANLMLSPTSNFSTSHDAYVKYWQLSNPKIAQGESILTYSL